MRVSAELQLMTMGNSFDKLQAMVVEGDSMRLVSACLCLFLFLFSGTTHSQTRLDQWRVAGAEARVCDRPDGGSCVALRCGADGQLIFQVNGSGLIPGQGNILVDGRILGGAPFGGQKGTVAVLIDPIGNAQLLREFSVGSRMSVEVAGWSVDVTLDRSAASISEVTELCTRDPLPAPVVDTVAWDAFERRSDESAVSVEEDLPFSSFSLHPGLDIWGGDVRSGLDDPLLRGIDQDACAQLCLSTSECGAFTHNEKDGNVCFLKTGSARMTAYSGATTGVLAVPHTAHVPPPTPGPLPVVNEDVVWRVEDSELTHAVRARAAAAALADSCTAEQTELDRLKQSMSFTFPEGRVTTGELIRFAWAGNNLSKRIPVWLVLSSPSPLRFDGAAAMVLGPEAPNPFGMNVARGETRAFVSLWARGAAESGEITIRPLVAGSTQLTATLVAWMRSCDEEIVLEKKTSHLNIAPAAAELVLGTEAGRADLTHEFDLRALNRKIEFGEVRFRLSALSDGTEVITRDGTDLTLSPTGRFLLVDRSEVIDIIDGTTVAKVDGPSTWIAGDSFLLGHISPWGSTDIVTTFGSRQLIDDQITGPSCCDAGPDMVHLSLDLENTLISLRGFHGYWIGPIQGSAYAREVSGNAYAASGSWTEPTHLIMMRGLGPVAPISLALGHSLPDAQPIGPLLRDISAPIPPSDAVEKSVVASLFRGPATDAISAFERIGLRVAASTQSQDLVSPIDQSDALEKQNEGSEARKTELSTSLQKLGQGVGWTFSLLPEPEANYQSSDCLSFIRIGEEFSESDVTGQTVFAPPGTLPLPDFIQQVAVVEDDKSTLMIGRMECQAGTTGGSLRGQSYFFVIDLAPGAQPKDIFGAVILESSYMASEMRPSFQDHTFVARRSDRFLIAQTPGAGRALVYDLAEKKVLQEWSDLPSGNLLMDVLLTEDARHILQINTDGGFYVHQVANGREVLSGRIVDDEIAVWTEAFRFDATAEAAALIDLRFPGLDGQFSLDRFDAALHTPELVAQVLRGDPPEALPVPIPPDLTGEIALDAGRITALAKLDPTRQARELRLYQDGILTDVKEIAIGAREIALSAARLPGTRHASILAVDAGGLASLPTSVDLGTEIPGGTRRALAVAVDSYSSTSLADLNYAKADADRFMRLLANLPVTVPAFEPARFIGGRRASPRDVLTEIDRLLNGLEASDHAVLFFAGHGLQDDAGNFYFAMEGTDPKDLTATALAWSDVALRLSSSKARITVLIDACHSGSAGLGQFATNDGAVAGLSAVPSNITIIAASKGRQQSIEARSLGGGLFSVALERVLLTERTLYDVNMNGRIEASELSEGLRRIVSEQSDGRQVPWITKGRIVGDYALF